jgi:hypothetical protein
MANDVKIIITAVDKASATLKGTTMGVKGMITAIGAISGVAIAAGAAIKKIADDTAAYNKQILDLTQVTGTGAEEMSRIVQVADDFGIEIGQVRTALVMMNKNGMKPSIENLATLADEYVNTTDKTAFAAKAAKLLGRQYTTLIPMLAKGGDALRDQAAAVDDSLIATDASIKAAEDYRMALDNWNDSVQGLSMTIGNYLLPELTRLLDDINSLNDANTRMVAGNDVAAARMRKLRDEVATLDRPIDSATQSYQAMADAVHAADLSKNGLDELGADAEGAAEKLKLIPVALDEVTKATFAAAAVDAVTKAFQDGLIPQTKYDELMRKIGDKFTDLTDDEINQQILLASLGRSYNEGRIPIEDYIKTLENLGFAWGKIPKNVTTTYTIRYQNVNPAAGEPGPDAPVVIPGGGNEGNYGGKKHSGGPVMAGTSYLVGKPGAEEWFTPSANGTMTPTDKAGGGDVYADITINAAPGMDVNAIAAAVVAKLGYASRNNRAGGAYRGT